jgi:hypothetical protein
LEKYAKYTVIELWHGQDFDWSIQSMSYCIFVANPDVSISVPHEFPRSVICFPFKHLQIIIMYWAVSLPTKGAGISIEMMSDEQSGQLGLTLQEEVNITFAATEEYKKHYGNLPDFLQNQLPPTPHCLTGVEVVLEKWHFREC